MNTNSKNEMKKFKQFFNEFCIVYYKRIIVIIHRIECKNRFSSNFSQFFFVETFMFKIIFRVFVKNFIDKNIKKKLQKV